MLNYQIHRRQFTNGRQRYPLEALGFYCEETFDPENVKPANLVTNACKFDSANYQDFDKLSSLDLIKLICIRWKQEIFFKIMKNHYNIGYHPDYEFKKLSPQTMAIKPALK